MLNYEIKRITTITEFRNYYSFLSNFHIDSDGYCVEIVYQASKFSRTDSELMNEILLCGSPFKAKKIAHLPANKSKIRKDWEKVSLKNMEEFLRIKFKHELERSLLIGTRDLELIEGNIWHDNFFGVCNCEKCVGKEKLNNLGKLLMKIRDEIKND